jgi:hypothetical protein
MEEFKFNPEIAISPTEAASLAAIMAHPGFRVWQKISRSCVDQFAVDLLNAPFTDAKEILALHRVGKVAAQLYTYQLNRMKNVVDDYINSQPQDKPVESAENLDLGEHSKPEDFEGEGLL